MTLEVSDGKAFFTAEFKHEAVRLVLDGEAGLDGVSPAEFEGTAGLP